MSSIPVEEVIQKEIEELGAGRAALCISGGGIRSATFALGVLQGLAERRWLRQFGYLSTVSGGGYIGSWLSAWVHRANGMENVEPLVRPEVESAALAHLRSYNSYLTPRLGAMSVDTWTVVAIVVRNLLLNWLVIVPLLLAAVLMPRVLVSLHAFDPPWVTGDPVEYWPELLRGVFWVACTAFTASIFNLYRMLPTVGGKKGTAAQYLQQCLFPLVLSATLYSLHYWWEHAPGKGGELFWKLCLALTAMAGLAWILFLLLCARDRIGSLLWGPFTFGVVVLGVSTAIATWVLSHVLVELSWKHTAIYSAFSVPVLLGGAMLGVTLFVGFTSRYLHDEDREWLARAAAYVMVASTGWMALSAVSVLFPHEVTKWATWAKGAAAAGGGVAGWITALIGRAPENEKDSPGKAWATKLALPVFVVALFTGLALGLDTVLETTGLAFHSAAHELMTAAETPVSVAVAMLTGMVILSWLAGLFININTFSLHGMYRNRLIRAYLAASNTTRRPDPFTGLDQADNLHMVELRGQRPMHVLNLALNVASTANLAWQERKAESFTVTPWSVGNPRLGYRDAAQYGGRHGMSLGTAMTISGAAASPNMGYHTSPLVSFVMMLFNARLGAWLGNPGPAGEAVWKESGPRSALQSAVRETLAMSSDESSYVYLSDGGHFENLALYEMVRRRCELMLVIDGGCDPEFAYEDLGNALRKIRIDLGVTIDFAADGLAALRERKRRYAVGRTSYGGVVLYLKPMLLGNEPPDVTSYGKSYPPFPHEPTSDQWFTEAQTESYRMLGLHTFREVTAGLGTGSLVAEIGVLAERGSGPGTGA